MIEQTELAAPIQIALRQQMPDCQVVVLPPDIPFDLPPSSSSFDVLLLGHHPPQVDGLALWPQVRDLDLATVLLVEIGKEAAVSQALKFGIHHYIICDTNQHYLDLLSIVITQAYQYWLAAHQTLTTLPQVAGAPQNDIFAEILNVALEAVIVIDETERIIFFNQGAARMFGFQVEEVVGQPLAWLLPDRFQLVHTTQIRAFAQAPLTARPMSQRPYIYGRRQDGSEFQAEASITKLQRNGRTVMAAILRDVTEQKRTEESLNRYTRRLEALREMDQAILAARRPQDVAQEALVYLHQLVPYHRACIMMFQSDDTIDLLAVAAQTGVVTAGTTTGSPELAFQDAVMEHIWRRMMAQIASEHHASPLDVLEDALQMEEEHAYMIVPLIAQGQLCGALNLSAGADNDFTREHITVVREVARPVAVAIQQARLLETEQTQRELTETLRQGAAVLSSTLDQEQVLRIILEQLARVVAYDSASVMLVDGDDLQVVARRDVGITRPSSHLRFETLSHVREVLEQGNPVIIADTAADPRWQSLPDTQYIRCWLGVPLIVKNAVIGLLNLNKEHAHYYTQRDADTAVAFADQAAVAVENAQLYSRAQHEISERKQAESALQAERALLAQRIDERTAELTATNAQLARAVRARDDFLASMTHELRTPLNAILGMAEILHTGLYGSLNPQQQDLIATVTDSGYRLLELINDILDIVKIEAGQMKLELYPVSVDMLCQRCVELVQPMAQKKQVTLTIDIAEDVGVIWADEVRLQQILVNLLNNGIKFTTAGQQVGLTGRADKNREIIQFTVWDTGIGMALEDIRRLFRGPNGPTPFMQLDTGLTRHYEGTGLGLSLIYRLTELHGGSVSINSAIGQGSRFTICLPRISSAEELVTEPLLHNSRSPIILLAEDNTVHLRRLAVHLAAQGYRLVLAHNGYEAVHQVRITPPDLMIIDQQMPELDGLQAIDLIRTELGLQTTPIIALTSLILPGSKAECLAHGADIYLPKPFRLPELTALIEQLLG